MATMTMEQAAGTAHAVTITVAPAAESTCGCGQALELCHTAHCPRCGITLRG